MIRYRSATVFLTLSGLLFSACTDGSAARPKTGRQMVRDRLAAADDAPYSAALDSVTRTGTRRLQHMAGRINLNTPLTGRTTDETEQYTEDVVITRQKVYRRASGSHGVWQEFPAATAKGAIPVDRLPQYVRLILERGGSVHRGSEPVRVSARLTPKDVESIDGVSGRNLRSATAIDTDVWVDKEGRIVRIRQSIHFASDSDSDIQNTLTLTDFKSAVPVTAPVAK